MEKRVTKEFQTVKDELKTEFAKVDKSVSVLNERINGMNDKISFLQWVVGGLAIAFLTVVSSLIIYLIRQVWLASIGTKAESAKKA